MEPTDWVLLLIVIALLALSWTDRISWLIVEYRKSWARRPRRTAAFVLMSLLGLAGVLVGHDADGLVAGVLWVVFALLWGPVIIHMMAGGRDEHGHPDVGNRSEEPAGLHAGPYVQCSFVRGVQRCPRPVAARGRCHEHQR